MSKREKILLATLAVLFVASVSLILAIIFGRPDGGNLPDGQGDNTAGEAEQFIYFSRLTGLGVREQNEATPKVVAVMMDNNPDGYPLTGLNDAGVVYEVPVEGSITRFMALYPASSTAEKVGPVRSARPYYLDWLAEYGTALYMHCGGSAEGLAEIKKRGVFDADEFFRTPYFWRDHTRLAPHNLYTSAEKWQKYLVDYDNGRVFVDWQGWKFGDAPVTGTEKISSLSAAYARRFVVGWRYNSDKGRYERLLNSELFLDNKNNPLETDNVVVQYASISVIDEIGRRKIVAIGEGEARVFRNGLMVRGTWKKENPSDRTRFYDKSGDEISLAPGKTWIMVVPLKMSITVSN